MKKKIFRAVFIALAAITAGWNYQQSEQRVELSGLALENVEALASGEGEGLPWRGYYSDWDKGCCQQGYRTDECSASFTPCK